MKKCLHLFFCLCLPGIFSSNAYAQKDTLASRPDPVTLPGIEANYVYQQTHGFEIGINFLTAKSKIKKPLWKLYEYGPSISSEFNFNDDEIILGPKISYRHYNFFKEFPGVGYTVKANVIYYISEKKQDIAFTPEVGLSFISLLNVYYGYNFFLAKNPIEGLGRHKLTVSLNFNPALLIHSLNSLKFPAF